jgi:predicted DCC family thiol-disulfide oxidoreductase YuxK
MIDISLPTFDPVPYGLSQEEVMTQLHVMDADGTIYRGIDGFRAIWSAFAERLPYRLLIVLFGLPGVRLLARFGYWLFARFRRFLPRNQCQGSCPLH